MSSIIKLIGFIRGISCDVVEVTVYVIVIVAFYILKRFFKIQSHDIIAAISIPEFRVVRVFAVYKMCGAYYKVEWDTGSDSFVSGGEIGHKSKLNTDFYFYFPGIFVPKL